jgi:hypothetical protein
MRFVHYIVDSNPTRCGWFAHGRGQKRLVPGLLREYRPALPLLTSSILRKGDLEEMEIRGNTWIVS